MSSSAIVMTHENTVSSQLSTLNAGAAKLWMRTGARSAAKVAGRSDEDKQLPLVRISGRAQQLTGRGRRNAILVERICTGDRCRVVSAKSLLHV